MGKEEGYNISDTGNWNVASDYSRLKIMKNLYLADEYANIAIFGYSDFLSELNNPYDIDTLKIKGLQRLINCLILLIDNTIFAIKISNDKTQIEEFRKDLSLALKLSPTLGKQIKNQVKRIETFKLDNEKYNRVLNVVLKIKSEINYPLNRSHLIFTDKEEFDPKKYKDNIKEGATTRG